MKRPCEKPEGGISRRAFLLQLHQARSHLRCCRCSPAPTRKKLFACVTFLSVCILITSTVALTSAHRTLDFSDLAELSSRSLEVPFPGTGSPGTTAVTAFLTELAICLEQQPRSDNKQTNNIITKATLTARCITEPLKTADSADKHF